MAADFTRFDFHAKKFYFSEDVQVMSAEEVGQYLLLLVASWLGGKDASLPDDDKLLAKIARARKKVSDAVLAKFPVVETEHGLRRRNDTLYEEWCAAVKRSGQATAKANARWGNAEEVQQQCNSNADAPTTAMPSPVQAVSKPVQTGSGPVRPGSSQSGSSHIVLVPQPRNADLPDRAELTAPHPVEEQSQEPDFKTFRRLWLNKRLNLGRDKGSVSRYTNACATHGAAKVHAAVDAWATEKTIGWMKDNNVRSQFGLFLSQLDKTIERMSDDKTVDIPMIEADALAEKVPTALSTPVAIAYADEAILEMAAEEERRRAARAAKFASSETETVEDPESFLD